MSLWDSIAASGSEVSFAAGEVLLLYGEVSQHCYAIRSGGVLVSVTSIQGATPVLGRRGPGAVVGELGALDGALRSATVRANTDVSAVVLTADRFSSCSAISLTWRSPSSGDCLVSSAS